MIKTKSTGRFTNKHSQQWIRKNSALLPLLESTTRKIYEDWLLSYYGLLPERLYRKTSRYIIASETKHALPQHLNQNNLEHICAGLHLIKNLNQRFQVEDFDFHIDFPIESLWTALTLCYMVHDIGEWGQKKDRTALEKHLHPNSQHDFFEYQQTLSHIDCILNTEIRELFKQLFLCFKYPELHSSNQVNMIGGFCRFVDKWEPLVYMRNSGLTHWRLENVYNGISCPSYVMELTEVSFARWRMPLQIILPLLTNRGKVIIRQIMEDELCAWHQHKLMDKDTFHKLYQMLGDDFDNISAKQLKKLHNSVEFCYDILQHPLLNAFSV